ncbi:MAG: hypothetical protein U9O98_02255, partial [Asgard group archaeon]|nr:hypothetical protein [Asgard group archaeon]
MASLELILNSVAIPAAFLASLVILFRNPENITNILVSVTLLIGGVLGVSFDLAKELVYSLNLHLALIFEKMAFVMIFWLILPLGVFSIFFWRSLYHSLPHFLHIFSPVIPLAMTLWLFLDETTIQLIPTDFGILTIQKKSFSIVSFVLLLIVFLFFLSELGYMAYKSRSFPKLQRKMISFIIGIGIGFIGSLFSVFIFPLLFPLALPPTPIFIIIGSMSLIIICLKAIARESQKFWHGCPKLSREIDGTKICLNVDDLEEPKEVNLLDISAVV